MKKYFSILSQCPLFSGVSEEELTALLGCLDATVRTYRKNDCIASEGTRLKEIGVVLSGTVQIVQIDYFGNRTILSDIGTADLFGEAFACANIPELPIDIMAATDCEILTVDCNRVLHSCCNACAFHARIIYNLMQNMAQKNLRFHQKLQITAKRTTREKLLAYLNAEAKKQGSNAFQIPFDRQALADYLAVDRSGLSAEISKLRHEGILTATKNNFTLLQ